MSSRPFDLRNYSKFRTIDDLLHYAASNTGNEDSSSSRPLHIAAIWTQIALIAQTSRFNLRRDALFAAFVDRTCDILCDRRMAVRPSALSRIAGALNRLTGRLDDRTSSRLLQCIGDNIATEPLPIARDSDLIPFTFCTLLNCFARYQYHHKRALMVLYSAIEAFIHDCTARDVSMVMYALGRGVFDPVDSVFSALSERCEATIHQFTPQDVANCCWALANLQRFDLALLTVLADRAIDILPDFKPQEISSLLWAFGKLDHYDRSLLSALEEAIDFHILRFHAQEIGNIIWAFGRLEFKPIAWDKLMDRALRLVNSPSRLAEQTDSAQFVTNIASASCRLHQREIEFFEAIEWRFTQHPPLLMLPQHWPNFLSSAAILTIPVPNAWSQLARECERGLISEFSLLDLSMIGWSIAIGSSFASLPSAALRLVDQLVKLIELKWRTGSTVAGEQENGKLQQFQLWMISTGRPGFSDAALKRAAFAALDDRGELKTSKFESSIASALKAMEIKDIEDEIIDPETGYSIDFAFQWRSKQIYLEADGPYHFLWGPNKSDKQLSTGRTMFKHNILRQLRPQVTLIVVNQSDWMEVQEEEGSRSRYLRERLDQALQLTTNDEPTQHEPDRPSGSPSHSHSLDSSS